MHRRHIAIVIAAASIAATAGYIGDAWSQAKRARDIDPRQLPKFTAAGDLVLPADFHEWIYLGSPLTPHALNNGKAGFPEFHNVCIEPGAYRIYQKTGVFPEGTMMFNPDHASGVRNFAVAVA